MRILLYSDNHWSETSSVIRGRGKKYSLRLENQIETLNWINKIKEEQNCEQVICLGDFFNKPDLSSEELTALQEVNTQGTYFIVGNHESINKDLKFSSTHLFNLVGGTVFSEVTHITLDNQDFLIIPYHTEDVRINITEEVKKRNLNPETLIILSHNDIKDVQYGAYKSTTGYPKDEILKNCKLFINGHIHNGAIIENKIFNIGSVTGFNFSNNMDQWKSRILILDTRTGELKPILNPYSFNFYKPTFNTEEELREYLENRKTEKNTLLSITLSTKLEPVARELLKEYDFLYTRLLVNYSNSIRELETSTIVAINTNYFDKFKEFIRGKFGDGLYDLKLMLEEIDYVNQI